MKKLKIHYSTYFFVLSSFFLGSLNSVLILYFFIILHELGHICFLVFLKREIKEVLLLPFGGVISLKEFENNKIIEDILIYFGGILVNLLVLVLNFIYFDSEIIKITNITIIVFNILPIFPLDGGRLMLYVMSYFIRFKKVIFLSSCVSIFLSFIILLISIFYKSFNLSVISSYLIFVNIYNLINYKMLYHNFLLNKYLNPNYYLTYKKIKVVDIGLENNFFKGRTNYLDLASKRYYEYDILKKKYKNRL